MHTFVVDLHLYHSRAKIGSSPTLIASVPGVWHFTLRKVSLGQLQKGKHVLSTCFASANPVTKVRMILDVDASVRCGHPLYAGPVWPNWYQMPARQAGFVVPAYFFLSTVIGAGVSEEQAAIPFTENEVRAWNAGLRRTLHITSTEMKMPSASAVIQAPGKAEMAGI